METRNKAFAGEVNAPLCNGLEDTCTDQGASSPRVVGDVNLPADSWEKEERVMVGGTNTIVVSGVSSSIWILDSRAANHMSYYRKSCLSLNPTSSMSMLIAHGTIMPLAGIGSVSTSKLSLYNVYCIHNLTLILAFISQLWDSGYSITFSSTHCNVQDPQSGRLIEIGRRHGGLYVLNELKISDTTMSTYKSITDLSFFPFEFIIF